MTQVKLLGELGAKFGTDWQCAGKSVREVLKLIDCQTDGFREYIAECHDKNIGFTIQNGEDFIDDDINELGLNNLKDTVIISPVPAGSGKGLGKIISGLLLIAAMFFIPGMSGMAFTTKTGAMAGSSMGVGAAGGVSATGMSAAQVLQAGGTLSLTTPGAAMMYLGANLAIMGITEMTAPDAGDMTSDPSYLFNGADNNIEQGQPVPVLYGTMKIGGTSISQGFQTGSLKGMSFQGGTNTIGSYYYGGSNGTGSVGGGGGGGGGTGGDYRKIR